MTAGVFLGENLLNFQVGYGNIVQGIQPSVLEINVCDWNKARLIHHISHHQM